MIFRHKHFYKADAIQLTEHNVSKVWAFIEETGKKNYFAYNEEKGTITHYSRECEVGGYFLKAVPTKHSTNRFTDENWFKDYITFMSKESFEFYFERDENDQPETNG